MDQQLTDFNNIITAARDIQTLADLDLQRAMITKQIHECTERLRLSIPDLKDDVEALSEQNAYVCQETLKFTLMARALDIKHGEKRIALLDSIIKDQNDKLASFANLKIECEPAAIEEKLIKVQLTKKKPYFKMEYKPVIDPKNRS